MARFTDRAIRAMVLEPDQKDRIVFDDEMRGLGLRISRNARAKDGLLRTFIVQWTDAATKRKVREALGAWGTITIDQARAAARARFGEVAKGVDVEAERRRRKEEAEAARAERALSLDLLIEQWGELHLSARRPRYAAEAKRALRLAFASHLKRPAAQLARTDVVTALDKLAAAGKAATAGRTMAYGRACYAWAGKRGKIAGNPFSNLPVSAATTERDRVLTTRELAEAWAAAGALPYPFGPFYRLAILTLQRREEVAGMRWAEVSADRTLWTIPAGRMKNSRSHDVHLTKAARAVLDTVPRLTDPATGKPAEFVFTTTGRTPVSGYSRAKIALDNAIMAARGEEAGKAGREPEQLVPWRLHDFRRTGVTHLAAMGFDSIVVDKLLAHKPAKLKGVASVYQRHDFAAERRKALEAWAEHVTGASVGGNVVAFRPSG